MKKNFFGKCHKSICFHKNNTSGKFIRFFLVFSLILAVSVPSFIIRSYARDSIYTKSGIGPLYWCGYENSYQNNAPISQTRFLKNVDWFAENYKPYGYNMVCTDGWIEDSTNTNSNGYVTSYNDNWDYTWNDLYNYCNHDGLELGVYYNPLWVTPAAVADSSKTVVGTSYKVSDIVDTAYSYTGTNPSNLAGDRFNYTGGNGDKTLYWVDVTKSGAEEYIKGYVDYFKKIGVKMLRIDFLSWYESGTDHGATIGKAHGTDEYETALKWIYEAAENDMEISLVMPNLYNNGTTELNYGDMARVNEDCGTGGWKRFSDLNRGEHYNYWSQCSNAFDGLIYWSQYFGAGKMIPDADMLRLNTFDSDAERKSAVSLFTLSGAPIDIADQYDTIGNSAWIYQNSELLNLRSSNFVAKPISADPTNVNSQIWKGMLSDGTWVVGLFNRESTPQKRSIDFSTVLGLTGTAAVRDLWEHVDLGNMSSYSTTLAAHSCVVLKISGTQGTVATGSIFNPGFENGDITGWTASGSDFGVDSNDVYTGKYKCYFWSTQAYRQKISQTITGLVNGEYTVSAYVKQNTGIPNTCRMELSDYGGSAIYTDISHGSAYQKISGTVDITNGKVTIAFYEDASANTNLQIDNVQIASTGSIANSGFEDGSISGWTATGSNYGVDSSDVYNGSYKCYFFSTSAYKQKLSQTVSGLSNGIYTVMAYVKQNTGTPNVCRMELSDYGGATVYTDISHSSAYQEITGTIDVTNGKANIAFYEDAPANTNLQIDDVQIVPSGRIEDQGFETGSIDGWTLTGSNYGVDTSDVEAGKYKCYFYNDSAYTQKIEQTVTGVSNGTHTVTAYVKQNIGTPTLCRMELSDFSGSTIYTNISSNNSYTKISGTIDVTNGQVNIVFYESATGANLQIDDVELS